MKIIRLSEGGINKNTVKYFKNNLNYGIKAGEHLRPASNDTFNALSGYVGGGLIFFNRPASRLVKHLKLC